MPIYEAIGFSDWMANSQGSLRRSRPTWEEQFRSGTLSNAEYYQIYDKAFGTNSYADYLKTQPGYDYETSEGEGPGTGGTPTPTPTPVPVVPPVAVEGTGQTGIGGLGGGSPTTFEEWMASTPALLQLERPTWTKQYEEGQLTEDEYLQLVYRASSPGSPYTPPPGYEPGGGEDPGTGGTPTPTPTPEPVVPPVAVVPPVVPPVTFPPGTGQTGIGGMGGGAGIGGGGMGGGGAPDTTLAEYLANPAFAQAIYERQRGLPQYGRNPYEEWLAAQWMTPFAEYALRGAGLGEALPESSPGEKIGFADYLTTRQGSPSRMSRDYLSAYRDLPFDLPIGTTGPTGLTRGSLFKSQLANLPQGWQERIQQEMLLSQLMGRSPGFIAQGRAEQVFSPESQRAYLLSPEGSSEGQGAQSWLEYVASRFGL